MAGVVVPVSLYFDCLFPLFMAFFLQWVWDWFAGVGWISWIVKLFDLLMDQFEG